tara:strand:- start:877 stop:1398 length:522 start_codon:yes stop_codon:yes gene_type:complete
MYFNFFPTVDYVNVGQSNSKTVTNILKRAAIREVVKDNLAIYTKYIIKSGETPESVAFNVYGDAELHWVILLTNDIYDRYHQWPMNVNQFLAYVNEKYTNPNATHHYEISQSSGDTSVKINIGSDNTDYPSATAVTNFEYEESRQDDLRQIRLLNVAQVNKVVNDFSRLMKER